MMSSPLKRGRNLAQLAGGDPPRNVPFLGRAGITDLDIKEETVQLGLGQRIGAFLLQRILRGQDEERVGQAVDLPAGTDLPLLHRLEHGGLGLGRRAVDFVGQDHVGEQRTGKELVLPPPRLRIFLNDLRAGDVAGHQVGRELDAFEAQVRGLGQRADQQRLGQARHAFQKRVAAGEDRDQDLLDDVALADDHFCQFRADPVVGRLASFDGSQIVGRYFGVFTCHGGSVLGGG